MYLVLGIALSAFAINNFTFDIDNKAHYFANGILCGVGFCLIVAQLLKAKKSKVS